MQYSIRREVTTTGSRSKSAERVGSADVAYTQNDARVTRTLVESRRKLLCCLDCLWIAERSQAHIFFQTLSSNYGVVLVGYRAEKRTHLALPVF